MENQSITPEVSERLDALNHVLDGAREEARQADLNPSEVKDLVARLIEQHQENVPGNDYADDFDAAVIVISTANPEDPAIQALAEVMERNAYNPAFNVSRESARMALIQVVSDMRKEAQQKADTAAAEKGGEGGKLLVAAVEGASLADLGHLTPETRGASGQASTHSVA